MPKEVKKPKGLGCIRIVVIGAILPALVGFALLALEYRSGLFKPLGESGEILDGATPKKVQFAERQSASSGSTSEVTSQLFGRWECKSLTSVVRLYLHPDGTFESTGDSRLPGSLFPGSDMPARFLFSTEGTYRVSNEDIIVLEGRKSLPSLQILAGTKELVLWDKTNDFFYAKLQR